MGVHLAWGTGHAASHAGAGCRGVGMMSAGLGGRMAGNSLKRRFHGLGRVGASQRGPWNPRISGLGESPGIMMPPGPGL